MKTATIKKPKKAIGYISEVNGVRVFVLYPKRKLPIYVRFPYKD